jgi:quinol monooxygenase YgiN
MYGTVARFRLKPGALAAMQTFFAALPAPPGQVLRIVYQTDEDPNVYLAVILFESHAAYVDNAARPEQQAAFARFADLLESEPEWADGTVVSFHNFR